MMDELTGQVQEVIEAHRLLQSGDRVLVGVSGGVDSLCLFYILFSLRSEFNMELCVCHLNHGFRREAAADMEFVRSLAGQWQVPFYGSYIDVPYYAHKWGWSAQEAARYYRYRVLRKGALQLRANKIALAHHADDQVETVLMNILHGTGLDGLAGMEMARSWRGVKLVRPLLYSTKGQIVDYCREKGLQPVEDVSNYKKVYRRNKIRLELLPYLEKEYNPQLREALLRTSRLAHAENEYLQQKTELVFSSLILEQKKDRLVLHAGKLHRLPLALQRRVLRTAWQVVKPGEFPPGMQHIDNIIELYRQKDTGKELELPGKIKVYNAQSERLVLIKTEEKPDETEFLPLPVKVPGRTEIPDNLHLFADNVQALQAEIKHPKQLEWPPDKKRQAYLDMDKIELPLTLQKRWEGARFAPLGMEGKSKKLKDYWGDRKIPSQERDVYPLIVSGGDIVWVVGMDISHYYRVTDETRRVLFLTLQ